jgi:E-phenylitaconyl-CoA hydratase
VIHVDVSDNGIATITMDRQEKMNALDTADLEALVAAYQRVRDEPEIVVAIITGAGDKAFCAGMDWKVLDEPDMPFHRYYDVPDGLMMNMPPYLKGISIWKPMIAAVNGYALGLGAHILLGCDLRIVSPNAAAAFHEVQFGDTANGGGIARLTRQIPYVHAMDLLLTGRRVGAEEMVRIGLVSELVDADRLVARAREIAEYIVENTDPYAVQLTKRTAVDGLDVGQSQALLLEALYSEMLKNRHRGKETEMFGYSEKFRR